MSKTTVTVRVTEKPSHSKGWARYRLTGADGRPVMESTTGNPWLYCDHDAEVEEGAVLTLTTQVELATGRDRRKVLDETSDTIVVRAGATATWNHRPGSQGLRLAIDNAE